MFAGRMKQSTFLAVVGAVGVGVVVAGSFWWTSRPAPPPAPAAAVAKPSSDRADARAAAATAARAVAAADDADLLADLVAMGGRDLGTPKVKDARPGTAKVNLYQDEGQATVNRLKVDRDRDDLWDEKWTFHADGTITRAVSSADDENWDQTWVLGPDAQWRGPEAEAAPPGATAQDAALEDAAIGPASEPPTIATLPWEEQALAYVGADLGTDKRKDVSKGHPWKINVYQDEGHATANRLKLDLDRDDRWDQKWTFHADGAVTRKIAPGDDEDYTRRERRVDGTWVEEAEPAQP